MTALPAHPILTCEEARALETRLFQGDESAEGEAMRRAGKAVAAAVLRDYREIGGFPVGGRLLVLAGKGHNGGDALIACREILAGHPGASADVVFVFGERPLRPLAGRAWRELAESFGDRVRAVPISGASGPYDLSLDGVFGFRFRPPLDPRAGKVLAVANDHSVRLRAAVDLPSGLSEAGAFRADFTYATGSVKSPILGCANAGRLRYLDLGFFGKNPEAPAGGDAVLTPDILAPLAALRPSHGDKRTYGHVGIVGGSRSFPGAVLMAVRSALRSGVGLVSAFVPERLAPAFAARTPEAMWTGLPESEGGLSREGVDLLRERWMGLTALAIGPGLGRKPETLAFVADLVGAAAGRTPPLPVLLDADALQPDLVRAAKGPLVVTPHAGEFARIARGADLRAFCAETGAVTVLKGPVTRIAGPASPVYHSFYGGPVLSRGGSGDLLAGLTGGLLARDPEKPLFAACSGAVWHGLAADLLARKRGQTAVQVTQLLDHLSDVLLSVVNDR